jgi:hypothetical protein
MLPAKLANRHLDPQLPTAEFEAREQRLVLNEHANIYCLFYPNI